MITTNAFTSNRTRDIQNQMGSSVISKSNQEELNSINTTSFMDELNAVSKTKELEEKKDYSKYTYEELRKIPYEEAKENIEEIKKAYANIPKYKNKKGLFPPFLYSGNDAVDKKFYDMHIKADVLNNPEKEGDFIWSWLETGNNIARMQNGLEPQVLFEYDENNTTGYATIPGVSVNIAYLIGLLFNRHKELSETQTVEDREQQKRYAEIYKELKSAL